MKIEKLNKEIEITKEIINFYREIDDKENIHYYDIILSRLRREKKALKEGKKFQLYPGEGKYSIQI